MIGFLRRAKEKTLDQVIEAEARLEKEFSNKMPWTPLIQTNLTNQKSALGSTRFADLEMRPTNLFPSNSSNNEYIGVVMTYVDEEGRRQPANTEETKLYARIEDPLLFGGERSTVEDMRLDQKKVDQYFTNIFKHMLAQSELNAQQSELMRPILLPNNFDNDSDLSGAIQVFNARVDEGSARRAREPFLKIITNYSFENSTQGEGPVSLRLSISPHKHKHGHTQSITNLFLGTKEGIAFRDKEGNTEFLTPGEEFETRYQKFIDELAQPRLEQIHRETKRYSQEEKLWGIDGECQKYFLEHPELKMYGKDWSLDVSDDKRPTILGSHKNVAKYTDGKKSFALKAIPFNDEKDLVRLVQTHQYVHDTQSRALSNFVRKNPLVAQETLDAVTNLFSETKSTPIGTIQDIVREDDTTTRFDRRLGPLLHQVRIDYEHKMLITVSDWHNEGMLADTHAKKRLLQDCSLSHRLRMAAHIFRNGYEMLEDDVTHTDLKPENILNNPNGAFDALQKARTQGWDLLSDKEKMAVRKGEQIFEGDFSGLHFGREGSVDDITNQTLPLSPQYSHWRFAANGLRGGVVPSHIKFNGVLDKERSVEEKILEQDMANRATTAWEIVYGSLLDCIPRDEQTNRTEIINQKQDEYDKRLHAFSQAVGDERREQDARLAFLSAHYSLDEAFLDQVALRSETIAQKKHLTPLIQYAQDNMHGQAVWVSPKVICELDDLANDFCEKTPDKEQVIRMYRTAEAVLRSEATRLENADNQEAMTSRNSIIRYMNNAELRFNPACGLFGKARQGQLYAAIELRTQQDESNISKQLGKAYTLVEERQAKAANEELESIGEIIEMRHLRILEQRIPEVYTRADGKIVFSYDSV